MYPEFCIFIFDKVIGFLSPTIKPFSRISGVECSGALRNLRKTYKNEIKIVSEFSFDSRMGNRPVGTTFLNLCSGGHPYPVGFG